MELIRNCRAWALLATSIAILLAGCSDPSRLTTTGNTDNIDGEFSVSVPAQLLGMRALDLDALYADVVINGQGERLEGGTAHVRTFSVAKGETLSVSVAWFESGGNDAPLPLNSWTLDREITGDTAITVESSAYTSTGDAFNADGDDSSNLAERQAGSDPYNADSTPGNRPDVRIRWVNPVEAPVIDGLYDSIWNNATFNDVDGEQLSIDNLMINQGATRPNGNTEFRWFAMHDDIYLYVFVFGEDVDTATPFRDSSGVWHDDSISLFFDGNDSKLTAYDGVDDRQIFIPLLTSPEDPSQNSSVYVTGENSAPIPDFEFANCLCGTGQHTWEIKLPMAALGIRKNVTFGFDVQLDEDNDGGARDARWGWHHPARVNEDVDNTWTNPSFMGRAVVE